jgi:hypothetical protein
MKKINARSVVFVLLASSSVSTAFAADVTVKSPANNASVTSPFTLSATSTTCEGVAVKTMAYSIGNGANSTAINGTSLSATVTASLGNNQTLKVKSWGNGVSCQTNVNIDVVAPSGVQITSPASGASVTSPVTLDATAATCSGKAVTKMGYSLNSGSETGTVSSTSLADKITVSSGNNQTLKVTATNSSGATCTASVTFDVTSVSTGSGGLVIPSNAIVTHNMDQMCSESSSCSNGWKWKQDPNGGGSGSTSGSTSSLTNSIPSRSGSSDSSGREFSFDFQGGWADELYSTHVPEADGSLSAAHDQTSTNFVYDAWVYVDHPEKLYALEFDMNQGIPSNGDDYLVVYGIQCNLSKNVWQYTDYSSGSGERVDTNVACSRSTWTANKWHHLQLYYQRDGLMSVFNSITVDGDYKEFLNETGAHPTAHPESDDYHDDGWAPGIMVLNFQIDSLGSAYSSGAVKAYMDSVTVDRW